MKKKSKRTISPRWRGWSL